jgi:hypothetical protein
MLIIIFLLYYVLEKYYKKLYKLIKKKEELKNPKDQNTTGTAYIIFNDFLEPMGVSRLTKGKPVFAFKWKDKKKIVIYKCEIILVFLDLLMI